MSGDDEVKCPQCGHALNLETVARLADKSRMSFTINPHPGELLHAKTVGRAIAEIAAGLREVGKGLGVATYVYVEGMSSTDGALKVNLLVARRETGTMKREPDPQFETAGLP